ncbi:4Fe-4S dicluster domain-containing protein [Sulfurovum riftiae]|uniref:4Fe-4S ferredoxin n=1 Tax=Sulfurovum riftiae TaxID=1630136 RepID=A0A151CF45_9BACT|nr:4Fe-4S dicluster domain-containing protein [Sulfurovum riftiae]KYJ86136.1 4Fe-4S ferredoxin [Sulfurovum riftiae]
MEEKVQKTVSKEEQKRRKFMKQIAGFGVLGLAAAGGIWAAKDFKATKGRLRPPGAVPEDQYLSMCIKCGQCLQVCPYDSILLEDIDGKAGVGTAYIDPLARGCYLCEAFPCVLACPTGALDHEANVIEKVHMGMAIVVNESACIALDNQKVTADMIGRIYDHTKVITPEERQSRKVEIFDNDPEKVKLQKELLQKLSAQEGKSCALCAELCPYEPDPSQAIGMIAKDGGLFPEIREACIGCGACVELCPTKVLQILPYATYAEVYEKNKGSNNA